MHYRMNNSNDYGHLRVRSNIVRLRGSQILSRVYLLCIIEGSGGVFLPGFFWPAITHGKISREDRNIDININMDTTAGMWGWG